MTVTSDSDIAIIGMAALFPKAPDLAAYWYNILNRVDVIDEPLPDWGADLFYDPDSDDLARIYTRRGGFLRELSRFDPRSFGIMPVSLTGGEPDQFHALDLVKKALLDAGLTEGAYQPETVGVILGHGIHPNRASINGVQHCVILDQTVALLRELFPELDVAATQRVRALLKRQLLPLGADSIPGLVPNMMTGRIANRLDLMGPNYIVDAACASSLIAVDAAMSELRRGRADIMLAGGVNTSTPPLVYMVFCQLGALSRTSRIRPFDAGADGTLLGEGGGVLVLKRLDDAVRDGNRIYAVLKSIGQSSDGRARGLMAPRLEGELLAMRRAYRQAGLDPASVSLLEAHGTGIPLGDQTEIQALRQLLGERKERVPSVALGSVKSMIGHCIPAAGIASLIKVSLALHHKILPPTLCDEVSPTLGLEQTPLYLNTETRPWICGGQTSRRAAVNAFGFGGVNTHAILEEAPIRSEEPLSAFLGRRWRAGSELLVFAQPDRTALLDRVARVRERIRSEPALDLRELANELWLRRGQGEQRLAIIVRDGRELETRLTAVLGKLTDGARDHLQTREGVYFGAKPFAGRVALLFPGENSQYPDMLRDLAVEFPQVRRWFDFLDGLYDDGREIAPSQAIFPPPTGLTAEDRAWLQVELRGMELGSESVFAADQALFALLSAFGVRADAMLGHSTGENAALVASGTIDLDQHGVGENIRRMNALYRRLESDGAIPDGRLLSVGALPLERVREVLATDSRLHLTMDNCTNQFILFGPTEAISAAHETLKRQGGFCSVLALDRGYHTPSMAPMAEAFRQLFETIEFAATPITLYSCATAEPFPGDAAGIRDTAAAQYVSPVLFRQSVEHLYRDGVRVFVEVGPESHLTAFARDILRNRPHLAVSSDDRRRGSDTQLRHLLGALFAQGLDLDLNPLYGSGPASPEEPAPYLSTAIPVIRLPEPDACRLRDWLVSSRPPVVAGDTPAPATVSPPNPAAAPLAGSRLVPASTNLDRQAAIVGHFALMRDFLSQQEQVMAAWLNRRRVR